MPNKCEEVNNNEEVDVFAVRCNLAFRDCGCGSGRDDHRSDGGRGTAGARNSGRAPGEPRNHPHGGRNSGRRVFRASHGEAVVRRTFVRVIYCVKRRRMGFVLFAAAFASLCIFTPGIARADYNSADPTRVAFDASGIPTTELTTMLQNPWEIVDAYNTSGWWLTQSVNIGGTTYPAGTQVTRTMLTDWAAFYGGPGTQAFSDVALGKVTAVRPSNAVVTAMQSKVDNAVNRARVAGRVLPSAAAFLARVSVPVTVAFTGAPLYYAAYKMEIPGQGFLYKLWTGNDYSGGHITMGAITWRCASAVNSAQCGASSFSTTGWATSISDSSPKGIWYFKGGSCTNSGGSGPASVYVGTPTAGLQTECKNAMLAEQTLGGTLYVNDATATSGTCAAGTAVGSCQILQRTSAEMANVFNQTNSNESEYAASVNKYDLGTYNHPTYNAGDVTNQGDVIRNSDDDVIKSVVNHIDNSVVTGGGAQPVPIGPGGATSTTFSPFVIPRPITNETYDIYIERLRELGWVGSVTLADDVTSYTGGSEAANLPNGAVTGATVDATTVTKYTSPEGAPTNWPVNAPQITESDEAITIIKRPGVIAATTPLGDCGPTAPEIDFSPFLDVSYTSKFPFGIFAWMGDALAPLTADAVTPVFDVPISLPGVGEGSIHVDLSPADPYMAVIRLLMTIGISIAALWLLASSLLGFKGGNAGGGLELEPDE